MTNSLKRARAVCFYFIYLIYVCVCVCVFYLKKIKVSYFLLSNDFV